MTLDYLRPAEPDKNRKTLVRFRTRKGDALDVVLVWGSERMKMTLSETDGEFDYYDASAKTGTTSIAYFFEIKTPDNSTYFYDKRGCCSDLCESMKFRIFPGFSTPGWAKGAVMYQIFVDRFCNGDKSNDVLEGEYSYNGRKSSKVETWEQYPDPNYDFCEFYGGDLQGVLDKLDYLKDLGIDAIYFNPLLFLHPHTSTIYRTMTI